MAFIDRTAYPRFRGQLADAELEAAFNPSEDDEAFVRRHARREGGRTGCAQPSTEQTRGQGKDDGGSIHV
jgi:hypothetical protein